MSQYSGFYVQLVLKDGFKVKGTITQVKDKIINLEDVTFSNSNQKLDTYAIEGGKINDLMVLDLPKSSKKNNKKNNKKQQKELLPSSMTSQGPTHQQNTMETDDDAIISVSDSNVTPIQKGNRSRMNSPRPSNSQLKKVRNNRKDKDGDWDDSGDLPEFDFQSNLAKFDKNSVFAELSANDSVDPSQRLVGHNKTSNMGTPKSSDRPKTNYEIHEMVKEGSDWDQNWDSIKITEQDAIHRLTEQLKQKEALKASSNASQQQTQQAQAQPSRLSTSTPTSASLFVMVKDGTTEKLPLCSPINLLEIERLAQDDYGYDSSLILENSGRGLSSVILQILGGQTSRISSSNTRFNVNSPPLVLLLVGNNRSGAKALNAGRQLSNHGIRTISLLINDNEGDDELISLVSTQLELFENFGGKTVYSLNQLQNILKQVDSPLELIVDALQGFDTSIADLMDAELTKALKVIRWANKQNCHKLSIDIPSGIDSGSGQLSELDAVYIESKFIVSTGLPLTALLHAYGNGLISDNVHYLVDIGTPKKIFQRGSLRKFDRTWFGSDWVVKLNVNLKTNDVV